MKEYITKGIVSATPISTREIEAGAVALLFQEGKYLRITITHVNPQGYWVVEGDYSGPVSDLSCLFKFTVLHDEGAHTIGVKHWKTVIANKLYDNGRATFKIKPLKFKEGKLSKECASCNGIFDGGGSQATCKRCSHELGTAHYLSPVKDEIDTLPVNIVKDLVDQAYTLGLEGQGNLYVDEWFVKQLNKLNNGNNISKKK